jgi:hypothetical protein
LSIGSVGKADAEIILKYLGGTIGKTEFKESYNADGADYNDDDSIDLSDVIAVLRDIA